MTPKTRKALEGSIRKWERIVAGKGRDLGAENCPLCELFIRNGCFGCPVSDETHRPSCHNSPYDQWAVLALHDSNQIVAGKAIGAEALRFAKAELEFLIGLRPKP